MTDEAKNDIKSVVYSGCFVEKNGVSICNLRHYIDGPSRRQFGSRHGKYQVWSERHRVFDLHHNIEEAVDQFVTLVERKRR